MLLSKPFLAVTAFLLAGFSCLGPGENRLSAQPRPSVWNRAVAAQKSKERAQQQQAMKAMQQQLDAAQKTLTQSESEFVSASASLQSAKSQLESAKSRVEAANDEARETLKTQKEVEAKLVAAQTPQSELGKALAELVAAQLDVDRVTQEVLSLPKRDVRLSEEERAKERLTLNESQKQRLKAAPQYLEAVERADNVKGRVREIERKLFENDSAWKELQESRTAQVRDAKVLEENRRAAAADMAKYNRQVKAASATSMAARNVIANLSAKLPGAAAQTGAKPANK